ncbi:NAD(P)-binding domain superfamily protein [Abortiporus biennis]
MADHNIEYVLVTGATGFIGAHIVDELLRRGLKVRAAVRSQSKQERFLQDRLQYADRLDFVFIHNLETPDVFDEAVKGVDGIIHVASPVRYTDIEDLEKDLIIPAIQGTKSALEAASKEPKIKRFIYTSSCAAVIDAPNKPVSQPPPNWPAENQNQSESETLFTYTNDDFNEITYEESKNSNPVIAYRGGKKFAELEAWNFIREQKPNFDLVTVCPPTVLGPIVHPLSTIKDLNESNAGLWNVAAGITPIPSTRVPYWVDVRDLAKAHVEALLRPEGGNKRFIVASPERWSYQRIADTLRSEPKFEGWAKEKVRKGNEGEKIMKWYNFDGETASKDLGISYRGLRESIVEAVAQFKEIQGRGSELQHGDK